MHALQCLYPSGVSVLLRISRFPARCFAHNHNSLDRGCIFLKFSPFLLREILLEATKKKKKKKKENRKILQDGFASYCCFIDFATAYPSVHRERLGLTLRNHKMTGKFWHLIKENSRSVLVRVLHVLIDQKDEVDILRGLEANLALPSLASVWQNSSSKYAPNSHSLNSLKSLQLTTSIGLEPSSMLMTWYS